MCGVFGIHGHEEAANIAYLGVHALQHRGQESAGLVAVEDGRLRRHVAMGLVSDVFDRDVLAKLPGRTAIGHVRYSTAGASELRNAQPFVFDYAGGRIAIAHNGNLVNATELRAELEAQGSIFQTSSDSEVIVHLMARAKEPDVLGRLQAALRRVRGAYSLVIVACDAQGQTKMLGVRDPNGFRPLVIGRLREAFVLSSETCSFDLIEAEFIREVEPGEIVVFDAGPGEPAVETGSLLGRVSAGMTSHRLPDRAGQTFCVFEHVYFARPDSLVNGKSVYRAREKMGMRLAQEAPAVGDVVIPVPDSGVPAAIGYSKESGIPFEMGLIRSHYVGRTFIEPQDSIRHFGVRLKLSPVRSVVDGKRVVVVDDSLVRGTTSRKIVKMLRGAGAREVHLRISAPPTTHPCFYGIDTPNRSELVAASHTVEEIARYVTCDSLSYLSHEGMMTSVGGGGTFCSACFTGEYPVALGSSDLVQLRRARV
ncbi:MAG: amidophosphoribosyltransferase [Deltaproteobacteria bacterium]|nr:amidophosphoribosyltransferase [Deltaproteobacteria bacterium]MCW5804431.1 amidophosphoribosyltransferase [Deltaproteobacteria bacterium]